MIDPVRELKVRAEVLQRGLEGGDGVVLRRLRALPELRKADESTLRAAAASIQRKHCLAIVGKETGFSGWEHARRVLSGDPEEADFGGLLCGAGRGTFLNHWFSTYDEARRVHQDLLAMGSTRYLLAFKRQVLITEGGYIESLGLDPEDADWREIGWDWVRPRRVDARCRLYAKLLMAGRPG
jgi:hypothetical protein